MDSMRRALNGMRAEEAVDNILNMFSRTKTNRETCSNGKKDKNNIDKEESFVIQLQSCLENEKNPCVYTQRE